MKINFTAKDVLKGIVFAFIPLLIISCLTINAPFKGQFRVALYFSYPLYLLENLKIKKLFKWIVIGVLPFMTIMQILDYDPDWFSTICMGAAFAYFMYPMTLFFFSNMKDVWVMSKEMNFIQKLIIISVFSLMMIRILRQW